MMPLSWSIFFALQHLFLQCYAYPRFAVRDAHPQITAAPVLGAVSENELLRRQDSCTWACAVCALYAPCENCVSLSTPVGIDCCTSKLADQSACPTANVPPESTIYIYTLGTLTLFETRRVSLLGPTLSLQEAVPLPRMAILCPSLGLTQMLRLQLLAEALSRTEQRPHWERPFPPLLVLGVVQPAVFVPFKRFPMVRYRMCRAPAQTRPSSRQAQIRISILE